MSMDDIPGFGFAKKIFNKAPQKKESEKPNKEALSYDPKEIFSKETSDYFDRAISILKKQGFVTTNGNTLVGNAFLYSFATTTGKFAAIDYGYVRRGKDKTFLISVLFPVEDAQNPRPATMNDLKSLSPEEVYVTGAPDFLGPIDPDSCPPFVSLKDFVSEIGKTPIETYFGSMERKILADRYDRVLAQHARFDPML